jgi:beta-lactamase regulating signal transducer with metallopeptidase domain
MTLWILWSILVSGLVALAAAAVARAAAYFDAPRRFVWIGAMLVATVAPVALALRYQPIVPTPIATTSTAIVPGATRHDAASAGVLASAAVRVMPPTRAADPPLAQRIVAGVPALVSAIDPWVVRLWMAASLSLLVAFGLELLRLGRERAKWREADIDACRALVAVDAGPAVVGFARPQIVVPEWALDLDWHARSLLLRHETEHIRAGDPRVLLASLLLLIALPWNAALWWMSRQLRLAIEIDCDARVIRAVGATRHYGMVLLAVSERFTKPLPLAASLAEPRHTLERRINAMSAPRQRRPLLASLPFAALALLATTAASRAPRPAPLRVHALSTAGPIAPSVRKVAALTDVAPAAIPAVMPLAAPVRSATSPAPEPRPTLAANVSGPAIDCSALHTIVADKLPGIVNGGASPASNDIVVLVLDANGAYVRGVATTGTVGIRVQGGSRPADDLAATWCGQGPGAGGAGGGGGGGYAAPPGTAMSTGSVSLRNGVVSVNGVNGVVALPAVAGSAAPRIRPGMDSATSQILDRVMGLVPLVAPSCCAPWDIDAKGIVSLQGNDSGFVRRSFLAPDSTGYFSGIETITSNPSGVLQISTPNQAWGLTSPEGGSSGIQGISASQVASVDEFRFVKGELSPDILVRVLVITLTPGAPHN